MEDNLKKELSVKSFTIKNNYESSISLYINVDNNLDNNTTNQQSKDNQHLNETIAKLFIGNHPLISMKTIKKISHFNFINKYIKNEFYYDSIIIDHIIHNDPGHIVAEFKDFLIMGDINEFLQNYYKRKESIYLLPKIYDYYISYSVIFPNYVILPESQYIYKNIQKKQKVIDIQQEQEDKEEKIKKGLIKEEKVEDELFTTQVLDSILNQTDTSGIKQYFGISTEGNSLGGKLSNIIEGINYYEKNKISKLRPKLNNCLYKNINKIDLNDSLRNQKSDKTKKNNNYINYNTNKRFNKNKKINHLDKKNIIQLSTSTKIFNEISSNNLNNGISLKDIMSKKKYTKLKNKSNKNSSKKEIKKHGRNCCGNKTQFNNKNFHSTTNSNGGRNPNANNTTNNSKCNTSRNKCEKDNVKKIINKLSNSKKNKRNIYSSDNNICNPKSLNIIKKSLINSLLNSYGDLGGKNKVKNINTKTILTNNFNGSIKTLMNSSNFDYSNNSKKKLNREKISIENKIRNNKETEPFFKSKHNHHLFSGLTKNDQNIIYRKKKNNDVYSFYNKNKLSNNSSIKNIKSGRDKNYSSHNNLRNNNSNLSNSDFYYTIKNKYKKIQKKRNKITEYNLINGLSDNIINNSNINGKISEISINKNEIENKFDDYFIINGNNNNVIRNKKNKEKINNNKNNNKNEKLNKNKKKLNEVQINSYKYKNKNYYSKVNINNEQKNVINLDKKMEQNISEKKIKSSRFLISPNNSLYNKRYIKKSEIKEKITNENNTERPLTVREKNNNEINNEVIEILTSKINKIKEYMKESDKKNKNTISHIFKKKKTDAKKINLAQGLTNIEENNIYNPQTERLKNKGNKNPIKNEINHKDNNISEKKIKSIYVNNNNKNYNITKKKKISNIFINNKKIINNKKDQNKKIYYRYNSNSNINEQNNYLSETNYNINYKISINNNKEHNKKNNNNINYKSHNRYININEIDRISKSNKNIILLNNYNKSCSLKVLPIKQLNEKNIMIKGIKINGFEKIMSKKYTTRNIDIPQYVTDRLKKINGVSSISNSNRYINTSNNNKINCIQTKVKGNK